MQEQRIYLDSSAIAKRYVAEKGTEELDSIFEKAEKGEAVVLFSTWNIGEVAVVLDKYERKKLLNASKVLKIFLDEMRRMGRQRSVMLVPVSSNVILEAAKLVLKHHMYIADCLQIASSKVCSATVIVTADTDLAKIAEAEGLKAQIIREY